MVPLQQLDDHRPGDGRLAAEPNAEQCARQREALEVPGEGRCDREKTHHGQCDDEAFLAAPDFAQHAEHQRADELSGVARAD